MCGIVGYLGPQNPKDVIINGLKKLEYRGYDSAGVAILHDGHAKRVRAEGKLKALEDKIANEQFNGHLGIGHTRWATHGAPVERNAHPHQVDGISLVHNGIIENYQDIKAELIAQGAKLTSDTDTELVAHLIADEVKRSKNLFKAVKTVLGKLKGAFSIVVIWDQEPETMVAFKDGPPLVVGIHPEQAFVASDIQALLAHTKKFVFLEDREIVYIHKHQVSFYSADGYELKKTPIEINWNPEMVEKQGFPHFMLKEIHEQPNAVAAAIEPHINRDGSKVELRGLGFGGEAIADLPKLDFKKDVELSAKVLSGIERVVIIACGTSYYAAQVGKYLIEHHAHIPVETDIASEYRYRENIIPPNTLLLTISQSGETADTLAALRKAKERGAKVLSICNVRNSSIDREAHGHLYLNAGPEIGVASTKAFTATLAILNCFAIYMGRIKNVISSDDEKKYVEALLKAPSQIEAVLNFDKYFAQAAAVLQKFRGFLYMGRGVSFPVALEGALKLKELAYLHAEGYAAGEMKHGPLALIDSEMAIIMLAPQDAMFEKTVSNLEEARARGGKIITIGTGENQHLRKMSEHYLSLPNAHWTTYPLIEVVPLQLMAYHLACHLGYDVDQPRNLAKSVTVE